MSSQIQSQIEQLFFRTLVRTNSNLSMFGLLRNNLSSLLLYMSSVCSLLRTDVKIPFPSVQDEVAKILEKYTHLEKLDDTQMLCELRVQADRIFRIIEEHYSEKEKASLVKSIEPYLR